MIGLQWILSLANWDCHHRETKKYQVKEKKPKSLSSFTNQMKKKGRGKNLPLMNCLQAQHVPFQQKLLKPATKIVTQVSNFNPVKTSFEITLHDILYTHSSIIRCMYSPVVGYRCPWRGTFLRSFSHWWRWLRRRDIRNSQLGLLDMIPRLLVELHNEIKQTKQNNSTSYNTFFQILLNCIMKLYKTT